MNLLMRNTILVCAACLAVSGLQAAAPAPDPTKEKDLKVPAVFSKATLDGVSDLKEIQAHVKLILKKVIPATVHVNLGMGAGSGVIISEDGYVLTAGHVSGKPGRDVFLVLSDGRRVKGKTLGQNIGIDSGLIKITDKGKWPFVNMGKSVDLKKGQWVLAVGHPGGLKKDRTPVVRLGQIMWANKNQISSDCALVGGDSGGPLFDMMGRVVGIHSQIRREVNNNIHVPVDTYTETWDRLAKSESWGGWTMPFLGIKLDPDSEQLKIKEVDKDTPAAKAGLLAGDQITSFDGVKVTDRDGLAGALEKKKPGDEVTIEFTRNGKSLSLKIKLGKRPE